MVDDESCDMKLLINTYMIVIGAHYVKFTFLLFVRRKSELHMGTNYNTILRKKNGESLCF